MIQKTAWFGYSHQKKKKHWKGFLFILIAIILIAIFAWIKFSPSDLSFNWQKVSVVKEIQLINFTIHYLMIIRLFGWNFM